LLNSKPAEKLMDRIMCEAGASLYPVHLRVSPKLWIQEVMNFDEVKQRRQTCIRNWLEKTPSSELERYARFSEKNMANRKSFISSLYNDVFYNLYFRDIYTPTVNDEVRLIRWSNFPERETEQSYLYSIKQDGASFIRLSGELMKIVPEHNGKMETMYEMGDEGEIRRITGKIEFEVEEHVYMKQFVLETEMNETINNKD
jgi:hypothetical protein